MARSIRTDIENNGKVDQVSRPILRTNPKLSTNVKLVVTDDDMYLESINASSLLANSNYKKYLIKESGSYAYDLSKFWRLNSTPLDLAFKTKRDYSDFSILDSYDKQYEESYSYGTSLNYSKLYDYNYRMLAPIWLDKNIPSKFVIYRIEDPINSTTFSNDNNLSRINEMLSKATLIKTIDLSKDSKVGKYLRNYVNDDNFPNSPLTVSFDKDEQTLYNGVDLVKGGFANKGEYQYKDTVDVDKPLIEYNQFITEGFSRNSLVCANLINLEFLFDDEESLEFSINRYFGIYVDEHKIGEGSVDSIEQDLVKFSNISHTLDLSEMAVQDHYYSIPISEMYKKSPMLGWVKSFSNYHNIKNGATWDYSNLELKIDTNNQDYSLFTGIKKTDRTVELTKNEEAGPDFLKIQVTDNPINGDRFTLSNLKKQRFVITVVKNVNDNPKANFIVDNNGTYIIASTGATEQETLENIRSSWYPVVGTFGKYNVELENINGKYQISIVEKEYNFEENHSFNILNSVSDTTPLPGVDIGESILKIERTFTPIKVVEDTFTCDNTINRGKFNENSFSGNGSLNNVANSISNMIESQTRFSTVLKDDVIYIKSPIKGYNRMLAAFLLNNGNSQFLEIETGEDINNSLNISSNYLSSSTAYTLSGGNNLNESVYLKEDDINEINVGEYLLDSNNEFNKIINVVEDSRTIDSEFNLLILESKNKGINGISNVYRDFKLEWGMFSAYDIYDFNFDFYDTSNSELKELELEENVTYSNSPANSSPPYAYSNADALTEEGVEYYSNLIPILDDEKTEDSILEKIYSEYDRLKENYTTDFSTISRIIPTINKWCLKDSTNVRENPYYLNVNEAFGETNFSPNLEVEGRDPSQMTHEWFYIDRVPSYFNSTTSNKIFSYINLARDIKISESDLKSINFDYFKAYFLSNGQFDGTANATFNKNKVSKKYSILEGGSLQSFASTIFKGLKFTPKTRKELNQELTKEFIKNTEFNGYRFSSCLITEFDTTSSNSLGISVIENKKFKTLTLLLKLNLSDTGFNKGLNRKLLYELDHKIFGGQYANSLIGGALNLSAVNLSTNTEVISGVAATDGSEPSFTTQILKDPDTGSYNDLNITIGGLTYNLTVVDVISDNTLRVTGGLRIGSVVQPSQYYSLNDYKGATYEYSSGGVFAHKATLELLSANNIANMFNNTDRVNYVSVEEDGTEVLNRFSLSVDDGLQIIKTSNLYAEVDINKPKSFKLSNQVIGYDIQNRSEYYAFLVRQNGNYTVNMEPIVTFSEPFSMHKVDTDWPNEYYDSSIYNYDITDVNLNILTTALYKKLNGCGVLFNVGEIKDPDHDLNWGVIKNHFFHKVNEIDTEGVIKLSEADDLLPKYQLINEIAIDKKDKNVFKSRWEADYYTRNLDGGKFANLPGTKNIVEEKSYIASSVIKTGGGYDLFNFTSTKFKNIEQINEIRSLGISKSEINFIETDKEIIADFYLDKTLIKFLDGRGVRNTIRRYVSVADSFGRVDTLDDDVEGYIAENILGLYSISSIDLYVRESKKITTNIESASSLSSIDSGDYEIDNNYSFKLNPTNPLNFRLIYNKRLGFSYEIRPLVKIKA